MNRFQKDLFSLCAILRSIRKDLTKRQHASMTRRDEPRHGRARTQLRHIKGFDGFPTRQSPLCAVYYKGTTPVLCSYINPLKPFYTEVSNDITPPTIV